MMGPDAKVEKVYLYPKPVDFRKSIDDLTALVARHQATHCADRCQNLRTPLISEQESRQDQCSVGRGKYINSARCRQRTVTFQNPSTQLA